jgi:hypothetical protein
MQDQPSNYVYKPYPRRLYLEGNPASQDIVVDDEFSEQVARSRGYRKAWEPKEEPAAAAAGASEQRPKKPKAQAAE